MSNVIKTATNKFTKGLIMDFSPENTSNEVLTHALNATLLTFNGNEMSLQNDMGNARVETAFLPEGYMPVGTCEYGGIIYIVSYNPLEDKSQIGCFPSPERNISNEEQGKEDVEINWKNFQNELNGKPDGTIKNSSEKILLKQDNLNPGDKFLIYANDDIYQEQLADLKINDNLVEHPMVAFNVVSISDNGKITYLNSTLRLYEKDGKSYHIIGNTTDEGGTVAKIDIDSYRDVLSSGYNVFRSKISGKLAILAELITIDSYSVTHSIEPKKSNDGKEIEGEYLVKIYTDIEPQITEENYPISPKLKYYYLSNSLGYLPTETADQKIPMFVEQSSYYTYNPTFKSTSFADILDVSKLSDEDKTAFLTPIGNLKIFNFPKPHSYHGDLSDIDINTAFKENGTIDENLTDNIVTQFNKLQYHRLSINQIKQNPDFWKSLDATYYRYDPEAQHSLVIDRTTVDSEKTYYIQATTDVYRDAQRNTKYYLDNLYKYTSKLFQAEDTHLANPDLEKFWYQTVFVRKKATEEDINNPDREGILVELTDDGGYQTVSQIIPGNTYYLQTTTEIPVSLGKGVINRSDYLQDTVFWYTADPEYTLITDKNEIDDYFDFDTYPKTESSPWGLDYILYYKIEAGSETYTEATETEIRDVNIPIYELKNYIVYSLDNLNTDTTNKILFIKSNILLNVYYNQFLPNKIDNKFELDDTCYPEEYPITLFKLSDFIPNSKNKYQYKEIVLADVKIPKVLQQTRTSPQFKYDYTITPCMNFGRLDHLSVSNTVDFLNLFAFEDSNFTTWKYRIDDNQLRLTFGADIYDTFETDKVDGLILEFYDLWGFAGSLEIVDKKSYSGIFTKLITLDNLGGLSKKQIKYNPNKNISDRVDVWHNVHIIRENVDPEGTDYVYKFNDKIIKYSTEHYGWVYEDGTLITEDNDCGTLYSNFIYGVKPYLRRSIKNGESYEYIYKENKNFFLFTFPIYNDYYYKYDDFSRIVNPTLDLVLTYKLIDNSGLDVYNQSETTETNGTSVTKDIFKNGYYCIDEKNGDTTKNSDYSNFNLYLSGNYKESHLGLTKYYTYTGTSKLSLEVGLKEDYNKMQLGFDPDINKYFTCDLKLLGESENNTFTVKSTINTQESADQLLNYDKYPEYLKSDLNYIQFQISDSKSSDFSITIPEGKKESNFKNYNFLKYAGESHIPIKYQFVVGYEANVVNIIETQIPATTVCALCHKITEDNGDLGYNLEDFGIYLNNGNYCSSTIYYNEGTADTEICGLCRLLNTNTTASSTIQWVVAETPITTNALPITKAGVFNTTALRQLVSRINKLSFCAPHAHCISGNNQGVNIYGTVWGDSVYGDAIPEEGRFETASGSGLVITTFKKGDLYNGISADDIITRYPSVNMVLHTKNTLLYLSEFISTLDYHTIRVPQKRFDEKGNDNTPNKYNDSDDLTLSREFSGLNPSQLESFNKLLIQTMKGIYAYNPDYNSLTVNIGSALISEKLVSFISNIVSKNANLHFPDGTVFNNYVGIQGINFDSYLTLLNLYSTTKYSTSNLSSIKIKNNNQFLEQINFLPNYRFCGTKDAYYLISSLTYNTLVPTHFSKELEFQADNVIVVKHEDGSISTVKGNLNKKALYAYVKGVLMLLDVSNYQILENGLLYVKYKSKYYTSGLQNNELQSKSRAFSFDNSFTDSNTSFVTSLTYNTSVDKSSASYGTSSTITNDWRDYILAFEPQLNYESLIIAYPKTTKYSKFENSQYKIEPQYEYAVFKGTSITINDLEYSPELEGHRLFIKLLDYNLLQHNNDPRAILFYRDLTDKSSWSATDPLQNQNHIYLYTGPCFVKSTLENSYDK